MFKTWVEVSEQVRVETSWYRGLKCLNRKGLKRLDIMGWNVWTGKDWNVLISWVKKSEQERVEMSCYHVLKSLNRKGMKCLDILGWNVWTGKEWNVLISWIEMSEQVRLVKIQHTDTTSNTRTGLSTGSIDCIWCTFYLTYNLLFNIVTIILNSYGTLFSVNLKQQKSMYVIVPSQICSVINITSYIYICIYINHPIQDD